MKKILTKVLRLMPVLAFLLLVRPVHAQITPGYPTIVIPTPIGGLKGNIGDWINILINYAVALGAIVTLAYIVFGGFNYVTAGDDAKKVQAARDGITNGVIGLIIIASTWVIFRLIVSVLNLKTLFP